VIITLTISYRTQQIPAEPSQSADRSWAGTRKTEGIQVAVELVRIQEEADLVRIVAAAVARTEVLEDMVVGNLAAPA
jgi:hypothetical protein